MLEHSHTRMHTYHTHTHKNTYKYIYTHTRAHTHTHRAGLVTGYRSYCSNPHLVTAIIQRDTYTTQPPRLTHTHTHTHTHRAITQIDTHLHTSLHLSLNRSGRWAPQITSEPVSSIFLFSIALRDLTNSRPVHSFMLSSHLFLCLPCLLPPFTVPC